MMIYDDSDRIKYKFALHYTTLQIKQYKSTRPQRPAPQALDLLLSHL